MYFLMKKGAFLEILELTTFNKYYWKTQKNIANEQEKHVSCHHYHI